jgi:hypothetical protein
MALLEGRRLIALQCHLQHVYIILCQRHTHLKLHELLSVADPLVNKNGSDGVR